MNRRAIGIVAGMVGSAIGAWWWSRQRTAGARRASSSTHRREQGTVIYHNHAEATPMIAVGDVI